MYSIGYRRAGSVADAADALGADPEAMLLAGGMSLLPVLRHRLARPSALIDLNALHDLRTIEVDDASVSIGAMATHVSVAGSAPVRMAIPALAQLAGGIGDPLVRNRGTIGGSLANNDPAACYPCALLGLGGVVHTDRRTIPGDEFIRGLFQTALLPGEIIIRVVFPRPDRAAHIKFENFASRFSIVGVFLSRSGSAVRLAVTGAGPVAFRVQAIEEALTLAFSADAIRDLHVPASELIADIHASSEFRSHLITELACRAVETCLVN